MKSKRAEGYVSTSVMIVIICMLLSVFVTFAVAVNTVKTVKRNSRVVLDSFVMQNSIEIYNSIKQGNNKTDGIDAAEYREALTEFCTLEKRGYCYYNYDSDGDLCVSSVPFMKIITILNGSSEMRVPFFLCLNSAIARRSL